MSDAADAKRSDFFEPVPGWRLWRRDVRASVARGWADHAPGAPHGPRVASSGATPDFVEPIVGWRVWRVVTCGGQHVLASVCNNVAWVPGQALEARCLSFASMLPHASPDVGCRCGVYAWKREAVDWLKFGPHTRLVVGRVSLWGDVLEADRGWRAGRGYPDRLFVPRIGRRLKDRDHRIAQGLEAYGVRVEPVLVEHRSTFEAAIDVVCDERQVPAAA
jgi:hypothetical protein